MALFNLTRDRQEFYVQFRLVSDSITSLCIEVLGKITWKKCNFFFLTFLQKFGTSITVGTRYKKTVHFSWSRTYYIVNTHTHLVISWEIVRIKNNSFLLYIYMVWKMYQLYHVSLRKINYKVYISVAHMRGWNGGHICWDILKISAYVCLINKNSCHKPSTWVY